MLLGQFNNNNVAPMARPPDTRPQVLVADDSRVMRAALQRLLADEFTVLEAADGEAAWALLLDEDHDIALVFTDLSMPGLDGMELLKRIRASDDARLAALPVIVITGKEDDPGLQEQVLAAGASDFVAKPFDPVHVRARARAHLRHRETSERLQRETPVDPATGLSSEACFRRMAEQILAQIKRQPRPWVWLRIDVDGFKDLYVRHGRAAAQAVITRIGRIVASTVRRGDHAATLGRGRIVLLLQSTPLDGARVLAERLRNAVDKSVVALDEGEVHVTVSIGVAVPPVEAGTTLDDILSEMERVAQRAAEAGGNSVYVETGETAPALSLVSALALMERGRGDEVRAYRHGLWQQLEPLLRLLAEGAQAELDRLLAAVRGRR